MIYLIINLFEEKRENKNLTFAFMTPLICPDSYRNLKFSVVYKYVPNNIKSETENL